MPLWITLRRNPVSRCEQRVASPVHAPFMYKLVCVANCQTKLKRKKMENQTGNMTKINHSSCIYVAQEMKNLTSNVNELINSKRQMESTERISSLISSVIFVAVIVIAMIMACVHACVKNKRLNRRVRRNEPVEQNLQDIV